MKRPASPQPLPLFEALVPVVALILLVGLSYYLFGNEGASGPNQVALVVAGMLAVLVGWRRGHSLASLGEAANASISSGVGAILILFAVGALIGTWALCGTIVAMVYYGLKLLSPDYFYVTAASICALISFCIGTSWTVAGTIGIGLMGIAQSMGLSTAITAGAVISGAYFGDKSSPLSDSANLAAAAAGVGLYEHVRETLVTSLVALVITLFVFYWLGEPNHFDASSEVAAMQNAFHLSPVLFAPLILVVLLTLLRLPPFTTIFLGALAGGVVAAVVAPGRVITFAAAREGVPNWIAVIKGIWLAIASGYKSTTGEPVIDALLTRGGMDSMLSTIWLIIAALGFGGVVEKCGVIERLIAPVVSWAKGRGALVASVVAATIATNVVAADQFIAVVLPARMFKNAFAARGYAPTVLSRSVGDSATTTGALIPWNSCGAYMAATLGVSTFVYGPYAVFCMLSPIITIAFAYAGIRMPRTSHAATEASENEASE
ncbi:Na+/H+ antiporter NhaC family protein [Paraburkholderia tropica]|uniref:Na+/H+ antiporter NhaC family protein n=1 Tax=Paraburkholderia tropica TaxID=92647 RepID=UPI002AB76861|nr:Na+/H+ antiporter NhaC family protein [Paraburkholderia tropica]